MASNRTGKYFRFRLADMQSFGEVEVKGWSYDYLFAYTDTYGNVDSDELFDSEQDALNAAIKQLRAEEDRLYRQRCELMKRLDEIEEATT